MIVMATAAQIKAQSKYDKKHTRSVLFKFNLTNDADILMRLDEVSNRQGYIKELIRNDVRGSGNVLNIDSIRTLLMPVIKKYDIKCMYLFGSYARGEANEDSDVDILIDDYNGKGLMSFLQLQEAMKKQIGKEVDLVEYGAVKKDTTRVGKRFLEHIERDKVLLYG